MPARQSGAAAKANITTFSDALWWAVSTVATVGYGDHYPVTPAGRAIGIMLMVAGVGIFGVTAAAAAAWFVTADQQEDRQHQAETITALTAAITALREAISALMRSYGSWSIIGGARAWSAPECCFSFLIRFRLSRCQRVDANRLLGRWPLFRRSSGGR